MPPFFGGISTGAGAAAGAAGIGGLASTLASFSNPITAGLGLASTIGSLFRRSPRGAQKIEETGQQQAVEQAAQAIQQGFLEGRIDADSALAALDQLAQTNKSAIAATAIAQVAANISSKRNADLGGSPRFQADRLRSSLRSRLSGGEDLSGTPAGRLTEPINPLSKFGEFRDMTSAAFPAPDLSGYGEIGGRLKGRLSKLGERKTKSGNP